MNIRVHLERATKRLQQCSSTPDLDAQVLLGHTLGVSRSFLWAHGEECLSAQQDDAFGKLIEQREGSVPIAYLTGSKEFWSLPLKVTPDTLIPRPDTECLVDAVLRAFPAEQQLVLADLGTGSGAIALALAKERSQWQIHAADISAAALAVARQNACQLELTRVEFYQGDWCAALPQQRYDVLVSNPPYLVENDPHLRQGDVQAEPRLALEAGPDGLVAFRQLVDQAQHYLVPGGWLFLEHGCEQAEAVSALLCEAGYGSCTLYHDLAQLPRVTAGQRPVGEHDE